MPTIGVKRDLLFQSLGQTFSEEQFGKLCFAFGLELDEVTTEKKLANKELGIVSDAPDKSEDIIYRIDIPANRYDLLCFEGLVLGLKVFLGKIKLPVFRAIKGGNYQIKTTAATKSIRPYVVAAVLRDLHFTKESYDSFIDLQDKLHQNICRKRTLVSIGTHDLDTIKPPFVYDAKPPKDIKFVPLNRTEPCNGEQLMQIYSTHAQLKQYLPIIKDSPVYPVIYDSTGTVLSLPPIINGDHSKITLNTKNVFIEITATDLTKASIVLDTLVCMFSQYCKNKYTAEYCEVLYSDGSSHLYPELTYRTEIISVEECKSLIGIDASGENITKLMSKMSLTSVPKEDEVEVKIPPTRHDVIQARDIFEDVAIAFGYNNIHSELPNTNTIAAQLPINKLSDQLRLIVAMSGFTEALTFSLCSKDDISIKLGLNIKDVDPVKISNPKTLEFQACRTSLLPGLLKTISANKKCRLPIKIFEISDVVLKDGLCPVGAKNERRLCAINCNKTAGFEIVHGLLDKVMSVLKVPKRNEDGDGYFLKLSEEPTFYSKRGANIYVNDRFVGKIGVLHPYVLDKFELVNPCSVLEINIECFL